MPTGWASKEKMLPAVFLMHKNCLIFWFLNNFLWYFNILILYFILFSLFLQFASPSLPSPLPRLLSHCFLVIPVTLCAFQLGCLRRKCSWLCLFNQLQNISQVSKYFFTYQRVAQSLSCSFETKWDLRFWS